LFGDSPRDLIEQFAGERDLAHLWHARLLAVKVCRASARLSQAGIDIRERLVELRLPIETVGLRRCT
jgi:hypothetical protein